MSNRTLAALLTVPLVAIALLTAFVAASPQPPPPPAPVAAVTPVQTAGDPRGRSWLPLNSEPMPAKLPGSIEISMSYGINLSASPTDPYADPLQQTDWVYVPRFYFETVKYDPKTRRLRGTLSNVANALTLERMQDVIRQQTRRPAGSTVNLDAAPINAVVIELVFEGKTNELFRLQSGFEVPRGSIPINVAVTDELLRTELAENLEHVLFTARTLVPRVSVDHARMDLTVSYDAIRGVLETLMPRDAVEKVLAGHPLLIDRSEAAILKSLLRENFTSRIRGSDKKLVPFQATFDRLLESMFVATKPIYDISKDELAAALKYDTTTRTLAPDDWKRDSLTAWETWNKHWTTAQSNWEIIKFEAKDAGSKEEFKSRVEKRVKSGLDFGAVVYGIPAKLGVNWKSSNSGTTEGNSDDWLKTWEYAKNQGALDHRAYDENSSKGVGDLQNSTTYPKILRLSRVVGIDSQSIRSFLMLREEEVAKGLFEDSYAVKAVNGTTVQADLLTQIARLERKVDTLTVAQDKLNKQKDGEIAALKVKVAEVEVAFNQADVSLIKQLKDYIDAAATAERQNTNAVVANLDKKYDGKVGDFDCRGTVLNLPNRLNKRTHPGGEIVIFDEKTGMARWIAMTDWRKP